MGASIGALLNIQNSFGQCNYLETCKIILSLTSRASDSFIVWMAYPLVVPGVIWAPPDVFGHKTLGGPSTIAASSLGQPSIKGRYLRCFFRCPGVNQGGSRALLWLPGAYAVPTYTSFFRIIMVGPVPSLNWDGIFHPKLRINAVQVLAGRAHCSMQ